MNDNKIRVEIESKSIDIYKLFREKVAHEDTLVNFRTSWFVTLQAFLFTSFSLSSGRIVGWDGVFLAVVLATVGIFVCWTTRVSVLAAHKAIDKTTDRWVIIRDSVDPNGVLPAIKGGGSSGEISREGSSSSTRLPIFVTLAWLCIITIVVYSKMHEVVLPAVSK